MHYIVFAKVGIVFEQGRAHLLASLTPDSAESQGQHELSVAGREIDLPGTSDVAIFRALVFPLHLEMCREILPSVRSTNESDGHLFPRRRRGQCERRAVMFREKHR